MELRGDLRSPTGRFEASLVAAREDRDADALTAHAQEVLVHFQRGPKRLVEVGVLPERQQRPRPREERHIQLRGPRHGANIRARSGTAGTLGAMPPPARHRKDAMS